MKDANGNLVYQSTAITGYANPTAPNQRPSVYVYNLGKNTNEFKFTYYRKNVNWDGDTTIFPNPTQEYCEISNYVTITNRSIQAYAGDDKIACEDNHTDGNKSCRSASDGDQYSYAKTNHYLSGSSDISNDQYIYGPTDAQGYCYTPGFLHKELTDVTKWVGAWRQISGPSTKLVHPSNIELYPS